MSESKAEKAARLAKLAEKDVTAAAAGAGNQPRARETVTVACKLPNGLKLQLYRQEEGYEPVQGGGTRKIVRHVPVDEPVTVFGPATPVGQAPRTLIFGGYALTPNVSKEFMDEWLQQNQKLDAVKNGLIFVQKDTHAAQDQATEQKSVKSGLEPLHPDPKKEPRTPKVPNANLSPIEREDTPAANRAA